MEVFLRNLPVQLTDQSLASQLKPFTDALHIDDATYQCEKVKKKNIGFIIFLHKADGQRFLAAHQEVTGPPQVNRYGNLPRHRYPPTKARLHLMNHDVFCKISNKEPADHALSAIRYQVEQRRIQRAKLEEQRKQKEKGGKSQPDKADDAAIVLNASATSCGHWTFDREDRFTFVKDWTDPRPCTVKFTKWNLLIQTAKAEIRISFPTIQELVWSENGNVAITLNSAPTFLTPKLNPDAMEFLAAMSLGRPPPRSRLSAIDVSHSQVSSFCMVYYFQAQINVAVGHRTIHGSDLYHKFRKLREKDLFPVTKSDFATTKNYDVSVGQAVDKLKKLLGDYQNHLPYSFIFMLQRLVYDGYLPPMTVYRLTKELATLFKNNTDQGYPISEEAFRKLFRMDYPSPTSGPRDFEVEGIMDLLKRSEAEIRNGFTIGSELFKETVNLVRIHRAIVTPTRIYLEEGMEAKNRILRKFPNHQDYFMRVQFCEENGQDLHFNAKISLEQIYERFKKVLANGISIGSRVYRFLGFSHSSLRAHSVWLSAPFLYNEKLHIPDLIITGLGAFDRIRSPARRAARIGQAFSETPYTVPLDDFGISVVKIPDVERHGRVFSDGVGTLSWGALEAVHTVIPESKGYPTCVQIRWAGAKGMLALDPKLQGRQFCVRPSMEKFHSEDRLNLEICDLASKPIPLVLNRQLVKILEDMGAPEPWFLDLQERELNRLRMITSSAYNTANFLKTQSIGDSMGLSTLLRHADRIGVDYRRDKFLFAVVNAVVLKELRLLKHKARIPVAQGITLFGIMDETGFLQENQVFVTYDTMQGRHEPPPEGSARVVVTRSPALHPGDIQLATNVMPPDGHPLREMGNCIVFSQRGTRDLPSQLSGGDLDGDVFNVIWDPDLVSTVRTFPPANYARVDPLELGRPVETSDMADFFIDFMKTDHLGVVATRHMILADQRATGTLDDDCVRLAELHSSAVDFSKTGRAVELNQLPKPPKWRPDFLAPGPQVFIHKKSDIELDSYMLQQDEDEDDEDGPRHRYYISDRILGKLYRTVDEEKIWNEDIRQVLPSGGASFWDQLITKFKERVKSIGEIDWLHRSDEAHRLRYAYDVAIEGLMVENAENPSQPLTELEVFVGFFLNKTGGAQTRRQRDRSVRLKDEFDRTTTWIMREMRRPTPSADVTSEFDALELCLACVYVGCMKETVEVEVSWNNSRRLAREVESFRVVAACALLKELNSLDPNTGRRRNGGGGGFVGVR